MNAPWLVDEGMEKTAPPGIWLGLRYFTPGPFVISAGVGMPVTRDTIKQTLRSPPISRLAGRPRLPPQHREIAKKCEREYGARRAE